MNGRILMLLGSALLLSGSIAASAEISAKGSDSTISVMRALVEAFKAESKTVVNVEGGGSGAGAKSCAAGEVKIAFLSRDLNDSEKALGLAGVAYAYDGVAVLVNKDNPTDDLSMDDLKDFFSGKKTAWADGKPVVLYNRNADSGTRECFQHVVMKDAKFAENAAIKHDGILVPSIGKIATSMGYTSASASHEGAKVLSINKVHPSPETIRNKTYPICRTLTLATKGEPAGETKEFIDFVLSDKGQAVVKTSGFVTLK